MPAFLLYSLDALLLLLLAAIGIAYFLQNQKNKRDESRIKALEHDLAAASNELGKEAAMLKTKDETSVYEKFAGLALAQMDRAVIIINQDRKIALINDFAVKFLDLAAAPGMTYKDVIHVRAPGVADYSPIFESAFAGKPLSLPENMELTSTRGTFPIVGSVIPLTAGTSVTAVAFIFDDSTKQIARVKEEQAFFSAAAHELRTPLTIIRMTVELLHERYDSLPKEKILEHLQRTDDTTVRLVKLVNDFLSVSRIDQGRLEVKPEKFDIVALTDEVTKNLGFLTKEHGLYIHHEMDVPERFVIADRAKASEVLSNLVSNGLKYTIQGGITIKHTIVGRTLVTAVTDTGAGISRESQSLLFKRFGQVGQARGASTTKSTGLGLYISKKLAQLMRGDVVLTKSDPGMGSTFAFTLPLP